jgi:ATP-dependent helicase/nuclease subunit A
MGVDVYCQNLAGDAELFKTAFASSEEEEIKKGFDTFYFENLSRKKSDPSLDDAKKYIQNRRKVIKNTYEKAEKLFYAAKDESYSSYEKIKALCDVVKKFRAVFMEEKLKRKELEFSDCEYFAFKALKSSEEAADELRDKYDEIYIDEYQDTNPLQDAFFSLISRKGRGEPNLFIVGDVKQSIYRFRHSDPTVFAEKAKRFKNDGKERKMILSKNFRSRADVINSVNLIFEKIMREGTAQIEYDDSHRLKCGAEYIEYNQNISELYVVSANADPEREEEAELAREQRETMVAAERIRKMVDEGFLVTGEDRKMRPVRYSDFALLTRALTNTANSIVKIFELYSIPCECTAKRSFFDCMEIRVLMALMKAVDNPKNDIPLASLMRSPIFSFSENELLEIRLKGREKPFYDNVTSSSEDEGELGEKCRSFLETLSSWRTRASVFPVSEFLEEVLDESGYYSFVGALAGGAARQDNLRTLLDFASSYEKTRYRGLYNFVRYLEKTAASGGKIDGGESGKKDAVLVTSIHKSKGLEFPVVFLIGCGSKFYEKDSTDSLLLNPEGGIAITETMPKTRVKFNTAEYLAISRMITRDSRAEQMRLFYVALTRAKEKLILITSSKDPIGDIENATLHADKRRTDSAIRSMTTYYDYLKAAVFASPKLWKTEPVCSLPELVKPFDDESLAEDDFEIDSEAERRLMYKYSYDCVKSIPSKMSVSEIKRMASEDAEMMYPSSDERVVPSFARGEERLSGSARGTAYHRVLELTAFDEKDVNGAIRRFVNEGKLTEEEANCISAEKIEKFLSSPIGEMLRGAKRIYREEPFTISLNASAVFENGGDENMCVQGTIDCFFETADGKMVLLDFKTDFYNDVEEMRKKYKKQLDLYELAIYKRFLQKCDKKYLYLFHNDDIIEIM